MALRAHYANYDITALRRVIGPVSTLAERPGHACFYDRTPRPFVVFGSGRDTLLVSDWAPAIGDELPPGILAAGGALVYDLSDAALLEHPAIRRGLAQASGALVPTPAAAALARHYCGHVVVAPTLVNTRWLLGVPAQRPPKPLALVLSRGRDSWAELVVEDEKLARNAPKDTDLTPAWVRWLRACPEVQLVTDDADLAMELSARVKGDRVWHQPFDLHSYPALLRAAYLVLAPGRELAADPVGLFEAGVLGVPAIVGPGYAVGDLGLVAGSPARWTDLLVRLTVDDGRRSQLAAYARKVALEATAAKGADRWLRLVEAAARRSPAAQAGRR